MFFKIFLLSLFCLSFGQFFNSFPIEESEDLFESEVAPRKFGTFNEAIKDGENFIEKLIHEAALPSLVFGLSVKGKPVYRNQWGYADLENHAKAKLSTKYRICSISKSFTSSFIGTLVDQGRLHYNDSIHKYLKESDFPRKTWEGKPVDITISQVLSHTAGLRFSQITDFDTIQVMHTSLEAVRKFAKEPLQYKPGTQHLYSNYGYNLAGAIIESVTKQPFPKVMTDFLHQTLKMNSSYVETPDLVLKDRARYYLSIDEKHVKQNQPSAKYDDYMSAEGYWSAGVLLSTVDDMLRYGNLLLDSYHGKTHAPLSQKTIKEMWTERTSHMNIDPSHQNEYAYGFVILNINGTKRPDVKHRHIVWHNGGLSGAATMLYLYPQEQVVGVAMTNKGSAQPLLSEMIIRVMENVYDLV